MFGTLSSQGTPGSNICISFAEQKGRDSGEAAAARKSAVSRRGGAPEYPLFSVSIILPYHGEKNAMMGFPSREMGEFDVGEQPAWNMFFL